MQSSQRIIARRFHVRDNNPLQAVTLTASIPSVATINLWLIVMSMAIQGMLIAVSINSVVSLGDELGWRAYLLPKLMERFAGAEHDSRPGMTGARRTALLVGLDPWCVALAVVLSVSRA